MSRSASKAQQGRLWARERVAKLQTAAREREARIEGALGVFAAESAAMEAFRVRAAECEARMGSVVVALQGEGLTVDGVAELVELPPERVRVLSRLAPAEVAGSGD